ncbi:ribosomal protein S18 [Lindgomyces ingoldianus]|uniref:Ribosomal protein S18 n=1 Tax=Lindgomyces ingoldianus TaxID=673940 RepID=A0ACB6RER6_9PLEO|nr:ribosomal protein S18 [Lindgomyces ingoldianus]KAF2477778.1 ribosomal protein S18 [Lindgomyces ingoldianus]
MSLTLLPVPLPASLRGQCVRGFSSAVRRCNNDILNILQGSKASQSHPSNAAPRPAPQTASPSRSTFAQQLLPNPRSTAAESERSARVEAFSRQIFRKWQPGDVYAPHDLSGPEQKKWKFGRQTPQTDAFDTLGINPVNEYKNFTMMSEYMTEMGRIKHSNQTGLRPVNQRKIAKAIRRAIGLGLMPSVHRHPLVLKKSSPTRFL